MKSKLVLAVIACLVVTAAAQDLWGGESRKPRALVYTLEGLGALGGCVGCLCVPVGAAYALGIDVFSGYSEFEGLAFLCLLAVSALPMPAAVGFGAARAGEQLGEDGSTGWAIGGAYAGAVVGAGLWGLGTYAGIRTYAANRTNSMVGIPFYVLAGLAIPAGAVVGYNLGAPRETGPFGSHYRGRVGLPAVALTSTELPDHSVEYGVKVQLAGLRF